MALYRPKYRDAKTGEWKESQIWHFDFTYRGRRVKQSAGTARKKLAQKAEEKRRAEFERAFAGLPVDGRDQRIRSVKEMIQAYRENYKLNHRPSSVVSAVSVLKQVEERLGSCLLPDLTEDRIRKYIATRRREGVCGRTINYELGELSRAAGHLWRALWPRIRKLEERQEVGRALSPDEKQRLLEAADTSSSPNLKTLIRAALLTGARAGELTGLRWSQMNLKEQSITIGRAKTKAGSGRLIPMNEELVAALTDHLEWFTENFGEPSPDHYVFPFGSPLPKDPTRPTVEIKTAWGTIRKKAGVSCRWHDLRHTACSDMNEAGVPEAVQLSVFGWSSRKMIERYSHLRLDSKREAMKSLTLKPAKPEAPGAVPGNAAPPVSPQVDDSTYLM